MRPLLALLHRWLGLFLAVFLFIAGLTGALISWDHELDEWLNPQLFHSDSRGTPQSPLQLADRLEAADPRLQITFLPLSIEPGHALVAGVQPRTDAATGQAHALPFNQVALDPASGAVQGSRFWGEPALTRENLLPFLYKLHYSLHLPDGFGLELGILFMGIVAIVWVLDNAVALSISFPSRGAWRKSFAFRWRAGGHKLTFDLHRSGGVWLWGLLLMLAVTSVSMNLNREVMRPLVGLFSPLEESPFATRTPLAVPASPQVSRASVLARARHDAAAQGIADPAGSLFYAPLFDVFGVGFHRPGFAHGDGGLGNPWLYYDGRTGAAVGADIPGRGSAGDLFMQAQFPLHSGRILGVPGRVLVSLLGLAVATLSATGVLIWTRKRRAQWRSSARERVAPLPPARTEPG